MTEAMGHGVNQRKAIQMTPEEIDAFLAERRNMTMCSMSPDGSIHAVAMWYGFLDGCVTVETKAKSQKVQNLRRDPRLTLLFEDGDYYEELRGVELVGRAEIVDDPDKLWQLGISVYERYNGPYSDDLKPILEIMLHKRVAVKLNVERPSAGTTASWACPRRVRRREIRHPAGGRRAAGPGDGGLRRRPTFYEGRPPRDDIAVREVVRHEATGDRILLDVRFAFTGSVSSAVRAVVDPAQDVVDHPDRDPAGRGPLELGRAARPLPRPAQRERDVPLRGGRRRTGHARVVEVEGDLKVRVPHRGALRREGHRLRAARLHRRRGGGHRRSGAAEPQPPGWSHTLSICVMPSSMPPARMSMSGVVS